MTFSFFSSLYRLAMMIHYTLLIHSPLFTEQLWMWGRRKNIIVVDPIRKVASLRLPDGVGSGGNMGCLIRAKHVLPGELPGRFLLCTTCIFIPSDGVVHLLLPRRVRSMPLYTSTISLLYFPPLPFVICSYFFLSIYVFIIFNDPTNTKTNSRSQ